MRTRHSRRVGGLFLAALVWVLPGRGSAAAFEVNPVRLELDGESRAVAMTIRNQSMETQRFQISAHTWSQDGDGRATLQPTQELFFFPSMMTLGPGESRPVRVGISSAPLEVERSFRLIVEELPPLQPTAPTMGLKVLTRVSIPVFVAPVRKEAQSRIEGIDLKASTFHFRVHNPGTVNFFVKQARVRGLDGQGRRLMEQTQAGWYVLPGGAQAFAVAAPPDVCGKIRAVEVQLETDRGLVVQSAPVSLPGACADVATPK
ncbi:fimbria/pilus periplasmic chaperone [Myxococcus stipitatus]|uniref:fimbrial biogenesis chaperone n=1 Tax=Myxococcus stipitatus TaxID=83455 RepID=UPI001F41E2D3|nr:fimbria/pilus periplasmic chaperone [Myxococcus stipitatus]MCE9667180.1 fimbria/pilus periplasmic chaperone [Myxococcus stipitatus]